MNILLKIRWFPFAMLVFLGVQYPYPRDHDRTDQNMQLWEDRSDTRDT